MVAEWASRFFKARCCKTLDDIIIEETVDPVSKVAEPLASLPQPSKAGRQPPAAAAVVAAAAAAAASEAASAAAGRAASAASAAAIATQEAAKVFEQEAVSARKDHERYPAVSIATTAAATLGAENAAAAGAAAAAAAEAAAAAAKAADAAAAAAASAVQPLGRTPTCTTIDIGNTGNFTLISSASSDTGDRNTLNVTKVVLVVVGLSGKLCEVTVDASETVADAKRCIEEASGVPEREQRLFKGVTMLKDSEEIRACFPGQPLVEVSLIREDVEKEKDRLQHFMNDWVTQASRGIPCSYISRSNAVAASWSHRSQGQRRRPSHQYHIDRSLEHLFIVPIRNPGCAEVVCPIAAILDIYSVGDDGEHCFPPEVLSSLAEEEKALLLMVVYHWQGRNAAFCLLEESQESRDKFLDAARILSIYAQDRFGVEL